MKKRYCGLAALGVLCILAMQFALRLQRSSGGTAIVQKLQGRATVTDRQAQYGPGARARWKPYFDSQGIVYPPQKLLLLGLKRERQLEIYAANADRPLRLVRSVSVLGLSGETGPKLRYGDRQVPEGFYRIESLNPNSAFHLSLRVGYPNELDRAQALIDGRTNLGGDIMIHGSNVSVGCLAIGDQVAEDLFILASDMDIENIRVILSPLDFRTGTVSRDKQRPAWVRKLYRELKTALAALPTR